MHMCIVLVTCDMNYSLILVCGFLHPHLYNKATDAIKMPFLQGTEFNLQRHLLNKKTTALMLSPSCLSRPNSRSVDGHSGMALP